MAAVVPRSRPPPPQTVAVALSRATEERGSTTVLRPPPKIRLPPAPPPKATAPPQLVPGPQGPSEVPRVTSLLESSPQVQPPRIGALHPPQRLSRSASGSKLVVPQNRPQSSRVPCDVVVDVQPPVAETSPVPVTAQDQEHEATQQDALVARTLEPSLAQASDHHDEPLERKSSSSVSSRRKLPVKLPHDVPRRPSGKHRSLAVARVVVESREASTSPLRLADEDIAHPRPLPDEESAPASAAAAGPVAAADSQRAASVARVENPTAIVMQQCARLRLLGEIAIAELSFGSVPSTPSPAEGVATPLETAAAFECVATASASVSLLTNDVCGTADATHWIELRRNGVIAVFTSEASAEAGAAPLAILLPSDTNQTKVMFGSTRRTIMVSSPVESPEGHTWHREFATSMRSLISNGARMVFKSDDAALAFMSAVKDNWSSRSRVRIASASLQALCVAPIKVIMPVRMTRGDEKMSTVPRLEALYRNLTLIANDVGVGGSLHSGTDIDRNEVFHLRTYDARRVHQLLPDECLTYVTRHPFLQTVTRIIRTEKGRNITVAVPPQLGIVKTKTLAQLLDAGPLPIPAVRKIAAELLLAIGFMHSRGIPLGPWLHRRRILVVATSATVDTMHVCVPGVGFAPASWALQLAKRGTLAALCPRYLNDSTATYWMSDDWWAFAGLLFEMATNAPLVDMSVESGVTPAEVDHCAAFVDRRFDEMCRRRNLSSENDVTATRIYEQYETVRSAVIVSVQSALFAQRGTNSAPAIMCSTPLFDGVDWIAVFERRSEVQQGTCPIAAFVASTSTSSATTMVRRKDDVDTNARHPDVTIGRDADAIIRAVVPLLKDDVQLRRLKRLVNRAAEHHSSKPTQLQSALTSARTNGPPRCAEKLTEAAKRRHDAMLRDGALPLTRHRSASARSRQSTAGSTKAPPEPQQPPLRPREAFYAAPPPEEIDTDIRRYVKEVHGGSSSTAMPASLATVQPRFSNPQFVPRRYLYVPEAEVVPPVPSDPPAAAPWQDTLVPPARLARSRVPRHLSEFGEAPPLYALRGRAKHRGYGGPQSAASAPSSRTASPPEWHAVPPRVDCGSHTQPTTLDEAIRRVDEERRAEAAEQEKMRIVNRAKRMRRLQYSSAPPPSRSVERHHQSPLLATPDAVPTPAAVVAPTNVQSALAEAATRRLPAFGDDCDDSEGDEVHAMAALPMSPKPSTRSVPLNDAAETPTLHPAPAISLLPPMSQSPDPAPFNSAAEADMCPDEDRTTVGGAEAHRESSAEIEMVVVSSASPVRAAEVTDEDADAAPQPRRPPSPTPRLLAARGAPIAPPGRVTPPGARAQSPVAAAAVASRPPAPPTKVTAVAEMIDDEEDDGFVSFEDTE